ncbi:MAG: universal stress protein [Actinomycetia bacterium]|nr:universal stress protein [Actinomycetes bacterium]
MASTLVFADDSSPSADVAWLWINQQDWRDWRIEVVAAHKGQAPESFEFTEWQPAKPRKLLSAADAVEITHLETRCDPRIGLRSAADRDLLVVGARGRGLLKSLHLGSTAESLMQDPPTPLVIARHGATVQNVVIATDGSADSWAAIKAFASLPLSAQAEVVVVVVSETGISPESLIDEVSEFLTGKVKSLRGEIIVPDTLSLFYHPRDSIIECVKQTSADLLVLGTRGLSRTQEFGAGSIASSLASHAGASVLMAKA